MSAASAVAQAVFFPLDFVDLYLLLYLLGVPFPYGFVTTVTLSISLFFVLLVIIRTYLGK
jgi:hypothetical protein